MLWASTNLSRNLFLDWVRITMGSSLLPSQQCAKICSLQQHDNTPSHPNIAATQSNWLRPGLCVLPKPEQHVVVCQQCPYATCWRKFQLAACHVVLLLQAAHVFRKMVEVVNHCHELGVMHRCCDWQGMHMLLCLCLCWPRSSCWCPQSDPQHCVLRHNSCGSHVACTWLM